MGTATKKTVKKLKIYHIIFLIILILFLVRPAFSLYSQKDFFISKGYSKIYDYLSSSYYSSQYVNKKDPGIMPDQTLESFAGGAFLKGMNPILIIHDQPPLGRYILSLSILFFDNPNTVIVLLLFFSGLGVFLVSRLILQNALLALLPLGILVNEPLFLSKFYYSPLLEPIQLPFIVFSLYFFMQGITKKNYLRWFMLTSLMLGCVISVRFFILGAVLVFAMIFYFLIKKEFNKKFVVFLLTLPLAIVVLLTSYARTIQLGSSIIHIFGIQKYIYFYHKTQLSLPFSFWDLLMFNRWHTWWGTKEITSDSQWIIIWPISMFFSLLSLLFGIFKKISISEHEKIVIIWIMTYSLLLSLGETSTRYFLPLLPFLYIIAISFLVKIVLKFKGKSKFI